MGQVHRIDGRMRKVIQLATTTMQVGSITMSSLVVLCDDGAVLQYSPRSTPPWTRFPAIPKTDAGIREVDPNPGIPGLHIIDESGEEHA